MPKQATPASKRVLFDEPERVRVRFVLECVCVAVRDTQGDRLLLETEDHQFHIDAPENAVELSRFIDWETKDLLWDDLQRVRGPVSKLTVTPIPEFLPLDEILRPDLVERGQV